MVNNDQQCKFQVINEYFLHSSAICLIIELTTATDTMQLALMISALATHSRARYIAILPPVVMRNTLQNSTMNTSAGQNSTLLDDQPIRNYDTTDYRVYIGFLVFGVVMAVLLLPIACSYDILNWYRSKRESKKIQQRKVDVEWAKVKMCEMTQPAAAYVRPERYERSRDP